MMASRLTSAAKTDVGLKRTNNEDNFAVIQSAGLYVLADGMGGHASGQVASTMCVSHVAKYICEMSRQPGFKISSHDPELSYEANLLVSAIKYANERVFIQSCKDRSMEGMGTTVTAIFNAPHGLVLAHVGDSRIYRVRKGEITQMSRDHSLMNHLLDKGDLKPEDIPNFTSKNVILRAIGLKDEVDVDVKEVPRETGDIYMMCSDGLSDLVSDPLICRTISEAATLDDACAELIQLALKAGGKDNVTVVCICVEDAGTSQQSASLPPRMINGQHPSMQSLSPAGNPQPMGMHPVQMQGMRHSVPGISPVSQGLPPAGVPQPAMVMHQGMVMPPTIRQAVPVGMPQPLIPAAMSKPQRMHSVREIVEPVPPVQHAMPKPIGSAGRSHSGMPAMMAPGTIKLTHESQELKKASEATEKENDSEHKSASSAVKDAEKAQSGGATAENPRKVTDSSNTEKAVLPETNLLFMQPPTAAEPESRRDGGNAMTADFDGINDDDNMKTSLECPLITDDILHSRTPSAAGLNPPSVPGIKPVPKIAAIPVDSAKGLPETAKSVPAFKPIAIKKPVAAAAPDPAAPKEESRTTVHKPYPQVYVPPKEAIEPPKCDDGDSIEISTDLYDDDDDVTCTFTPNFKKW